ncbi:MAG TPA: hypothetical protein ENH86_02830 [Candidatus Jorgensenbacteria bacterium]|nr:hypothetical protein [Candidatus Jorgensenbacteria bacterium]
MKKRYGEGQVLIEAIVAISIGVVGLLGFLQLLTQAVSINKDVGQKFVATYLAAEGIEIVKSLVDENYTATPRAAWGTGLADGSYEVAYNATALGSNLGARSTAVLNYDFTSGLYDYTAGEISTSFIRTIELTNLGTGGDNELKVVSIVQWTARGETKKVILESHFFNWRLRP